MNNTEGKLTGVFAPTVTPFKNDQLLIDALKGNIKKLNQTDLKGYLVLGSNGEFRSLSDREQLEVLSVFARNKEGNVLIAGCGCESTIQTIEKTRMAADLGYDFNLVLPPHYFNKRMSEESIIEHYERVAASSPIPIILYNAPGYTAGVEITPQIFKHLAGHENIVGLKDSSSQGPNRFLSFLDSTSNIHVLAGSTNLFYPCLHLGSIGGILSISNFLPNQCVRLFRLFQEGKFKEARKLHFSLTRLNIGISVKYGVAGVKYAMDCCGFTGGEPRLPLLPISHVGRDEIRNLLLKEGYINE